MPAKPRRGAQSRRSLPLIWRVRMTLSRLHRWFCTAAESALRNSAHAVLRVFRWTSVMSVQLWQAAYIAIGCLYHHLVDPALCLSCIYLGVLSTLYLPIVIFVGLAPTLLVGLGVTTLTKESMVQLFAVANSFDTLKIAVPLTLAVFRRYYSEWQTNSAPLLARMCYAMYAGVVWPRVWFRSRTAQASA